MFKKAVKVDAKLRLSIQGPAGSGKTYTALTLATHLGGPIAVIDTEHGSASKYADLFDFDVMEMEPPFHPDRFCEAIRDAAQNGYKIVIIDSLTHAWNSEGGMLDIVNKIAKQKYNGNTYVAWNDATAIQKRLIESIVGAPIHVIATMRSKMDYVLETNEKGKQTPKKVGMAPEQRNDLPYEFDVVFEMNNENEANVTKTRCPALTGELIHKPGKQVAETLRKWLAGTPNATPTPVQRQPVAIETPSSNGHTEQTEAMPTAVLPTDQIEFAANLAKSFDGPPAAWKWSVDAGYYQNEHPARTCWTRIVKEKGGYSPAKLQEIATEFVKHQLAKNVQEAA